MKDKIEIEQQEEELFSLFHCIYMRIKENRGEFKKSFKGEKLGILDREISKACKDFIKDNPDLCIDV